MVRVITNISSSVHLNSIAIKVLAAVRPNKMDHEDKNSYSVEKGFSRKLPFLVKNDETDIGKMN